MASKPPEEWYQLLASWSAELLSATGRIHHLIGNHHQPTKGSYREALLRRLLRRVLPGRFRVSTGFIYRWGEEPSRQLDVLIWDAQTHSALLEEGELVVLTADSVAAIVEVKSVLTKTGLLDGLDLLMPPWLVSWRYTSESSKEGLAQQVPEVPFRAIFAYSADTTSVDTTASAVFEHLAEFYRKQFGADAQKALCHRGANLRWTNLIDAICIADQLEIEQTILQVDGENGRLYDGPAFAAFVADSSVGSLAVGKFCMYLLWHLTGWDGGQAPYTTVHSPLPVSNPGVCCFSNLSMLKHVRLGGAEILRDAVWSPEPPLWFGSLHGENP